MTKTAAGWDPLANIRKLVLGGIGADFLWPSPYWKTPGEIYQIDILLHLSTLKISTIFCQPVFVTNDLQYVQKRTNATFVTKSRRITTNVDILVYKISEHV